MIVINRLVRKNKFGGLTWELEIDLLHRLFLNGTDNSSIVVEFKEWKFLSFKTHFTFVSTDDLIETISESMDRMCDFLKNKKGLSWNSQKQEVIHEEILQFISLYDLLNKWNVD